MSRIKKLTVTSTARLLLQAMILGLLVLVGVDLLFQDASFKNSYSWVIEWVALGDLQMIPLLILGGLCLFLPVAYLFVRWIEHKLERGIVGKGTEGEDICLTPEAVERAVVREIREKVPEVLKVRSCTALQGRKGARVTLRIAISDRSPVPNVQASSRQVVTDVLTRLIGFADASEVRIKVDDVVGAGKTRSGQGREKKKRPVDARKPKPEEKAP